MITSETNLAHLKRSEQFDAWRESGAQILLSWQAKDASPSKDIHIRRWFANKNGPPALLHLSTPSHNLRSPERWPSFFDGRFLVIFWRESGAFYGLIENEPIFNATGTVYIYDAHRKISGLHSAGEQCSFWLPYDMVGYDPDIHPASQKLDLGSSIGQFLIPSLHAAAKAIRNATDPYPEAIFDGVAGLVQALFFKRPGSDIERKRFNDGLRRAVIDYIDRNIEQPDLGLSSIQKKFKLSRSTLYRLFEEDEGVATHIRSKRLTIAYQKLITEPKNYPSIYSLAESIGFVDSNHFTRCFRSRFDITPSDLLNLGKNMKDWDPGQI